MGKSQEKYNEAKKIIPGGTQLLSKRPEMFLPELWPAYYSKAKGCEVWDLDNNRFIDMSYMGIGSCIIGYSDDDVNNKVVDCIQKGSMTTLNAPEEVELANLLLDIHPWADMVRYARTGGEAVAMAVRIARAKTGKNKVLFSGYHGWSDWYIAANLSDDKALNKHLIPGLSPDGVPSDLKNTSFPFYYNDTKGFLRLVEEHKGEIAAIVAEPIRNILPNDDYFPTLRKVADEHGIVLIADEVSSGWRLNVGGAHLILNYQPDIAVFAKGLSNGFPMAALIGKGEIMDAAQSSFISSTFWTERIGPVAAIASIRKMLDNNIPKHLEKVGKQVQEGWEIAAKKVNLKIKVSGIYPLGHFEFIDDNPLVLKTLFTQIMLEEGFLATNAFYASFSHSVDIVDKYLISVEKAFSIIVQSIEKGNSEELLKGPICQSGFKRLT